MLLFCGIILFVINMKKIIVSVLIIVFVMLGFYFKFYKLKENDDNRKLFDKYLNDYEYKINQEKESLNSKITDIEKEKDGFKENLVNERITFIGDSVMLGAEKVIKKKFKNAYVDAAISRTAWVLNEAVETARSKGKLGDIIVINLGANGDCSLSCKKQVLDKLKNKQIFWLNTTNYDYVNERLDSLAKEYSNLYIIDWKNLSKNHSNYFNSDKIHLTTVGAQEFVETIFNSVYEVNAKKYDEEKKKLQDDYNSKLRNEISFYGDNTLVNNFNYLVDKFDGNRFYKTECSDISELINVEIKNNTLSNKIVLVYDNKCNIKIKANSKVYYYDGDINKVINDIQKNI